ncbi:hypothetical protein C2E21_8817 [Chlorella sorokiniana]|uniref:Uncharacterized protein n=1 Tax=Chlorella sorokiniana TaxID=3076 RepID=A0A2P6TDF6_CHLSO|nr:hypothetical protein C2E21_8817 [Chlorella sorokiniana]|eukprot:PRW20669.1 hypothetical protein C2E21_8817 [Chlorella sorokiniana]
MLATHLSSRAVWLPSAWQACWKLHHTSTTALTYSKRLCHTCLTRMRAFGKAHRLV